jgi:hypothetical protein
MEKPPGKNNEQRDRCRRAERRDGLDQPSRQAKAVHAIGGAQPQQAMPQRCDGQSRPD